MPSPSTTSRFPPEFLQAFQTAQEQGSFLIPTSHPHALKCTLWAFARALRREGNSLLADSIKVAPRTEGVLLSRRSEDPAAKEIAAALKALPLNEEAENLFNRLP